MSNNVDAQCVLITKLLEGMGMGVVDSLISRSEDTLWLLPVNEGGNELEGDRRDARAFRIWRIDSRGEGPDPELEQRRLA